ncbi:MAG: acetylglutamate kinase [Vicinamibacterales bacterium]
MRAPVVLKLGGELLEDAAAVGATARAATALAWAGPLVIVHGGGRAIDAELRARAIEPRFVDGLRVTDAPTLDVVISVLAGRNNTTLVAALNAAGVRGVGLTGADAGIGASAKVPLFTSTAGAQVDLGLVGQPSLDAAPLLADLLRLGYVPVIASVGSTTDGELLNVNADTLAGHLAAVLNARRLIIAGGTDGVLDTTGALVEELTTEAVSNMIASGVAHSGMVAKLAACRVAVAAGVADVAIVRGRGIDDFNTVRGTQIVPAQLLTART